MFANLGPLPADPLLVLIDMHRRDPRPDKIDLGVGVYRDAAGDTPVLASVKAAEAQLLAEQDSKSYLGPEGDMRFVELLAPILFGAGYRHGDRLTGVQTPSGTGALRLGAELIARARPDARVWIGTPSWPIHAPIFGRAGLEVEAHRLFDEATRELDFAGMMAGIERAVPGDVLLLHACCHNPTGAGFTIEQWAELAIWMATRGVVPFIDLAYQGLGDGLEADAAGLRIVLQAVPEALIAYSCDKNFGLYRDRVGALWVQAGSSAAIGPITDNVLTLARSLWSMPPDHGAALVRLILESELLIADWHQELDAMRGRLNGLRTAFAVMHPRLAPIGRQRGMFAILPLSPEQVVQVREDHGIYMAGSGRINVAGLQEATIPRIATALLPFFD
ncbi:amino acid aminotransferase [Sphingomonas sp. M1-B02]|uniref:amino acid aminotransferase n=1 Tax=Sphingomonas sp. M1-B02 TaxID=3114300 RepID=UPI00223F57C5|nr:amino acid aminotransferase [Sphingomonas sp. S6-11]UZK66612.1 aspartate/tyrosine/aromatic aminotransferase [Sphingomonas sp. S6-11]